MGYFWKSLPLDYLSLFASENAHRIVSRSIIRMGKELGIS
jgi:hypothetical protein